MCAPPRAGRRSRGRPCEWAAATLLLALLAAAPPGAAAQDPPAAPDSSAVRLRGGETWRADFTRHSVPLSEIVSGGPPKDGIPALDHPTFVPASAADRWLSDRDPVIVVEHGGETKAYPLAILLFHEIVNDRVGGLPVAVTYCPLCNTALVFERRVDGRVLDFGTTGRLRHSDLVMYDRQTESWWQQASGEAIVGSLTGTELGFLSANTYGWERARQLYPDLEVLSRETGYDRPYGRNPYVGYDRPGQDPIPQFFRGPVDGRMPAMERVAGVLLGEGWAVPFRALRERRVAQATVAGRPVVVFWAPGAASALDGPIVRDGRDVGQSAAFARSVGDVVLDFEWRDDAFRDRQTGSTWDLSGRATAGPLTRQRLQPVPHADYLWFAWAAFRPSAPIWAP